VILSAVPGKARFWERIKNVQLNSRQRSVIKRLPEGFEGKLTTSKYSTLAKCSQDTAYRDILALVDHGVLTQNPEGGAVRVIRLPPRNNRCFSGWLPCAHPALASASTPWLPSFITD
jgi:Fic family protein